MGGDSRSSGDSTGQTPPASESPTASFPHVAHSPIGEQPGDSIGPYRLLEVIGEGGFGVVFLAERREPMVQRVALKVIKPGMDSKSVIARFEQERQALAVMDHPNVAKVFDGGVTPTGRPYFVMEHVQGEPVTTFCDRHTYSIRQRLNLFIPICEAVQHAHIKGIIHRDLKPSNILVATKDGNAIPKVIDFGVAKAISHTLTDKTIFTETGHLIGTPEYMSPEQAEMGRLDIDTRTDVYSLGVVLYELLTGLLPFDPESLRSAGYEAIRKIIREVDPPKPSTRLSTIGNSEGTVHARNRKIQPEALAAQLRRELDWIPLKALRKDRTQRYSTPADLARDVRRYLEGEPLDAGPESTTYRLKKLVRRNEGPVAAIGAVILALALGLAGTWWKAEQLRESEIEQSRLAKSESIARREADEKTAETQHARDAAEFESYVANLIAADASLSANEPARVRARLDACPERMRGWEWRWLNSRADMSLAVLSPATFATFNSSGDLIVTGGLDRSARVWDAATGKEQAVLRGHEAAVTSARFSPSGDRVVTVSADKTARVWDVSACKELAVLRGHTEYITDVAFSPSGDRIVTASRDTTARVWDATTGRELGALRGHAGDVRTAAFNPSGTRIVTASSDGTARVWDAVNGAELAQLHGHNGSVWSAAFSPAGDSIVTASSDTTARMWDVKTGKELVTLRGHAASVTSACFSPAGDRIVTASSDTSARVWDATTGKELVRLRGHEGGVESAAFSASADRIVTMSSDKTVRMWDAATGEPLPFLGTGNSRPVQGTRNLNVTSSAAFSPSGDRILIVYEDMTARVWDADTGEEMLGLHAYASAVRSASFSPAGDRVVVGLGDKTASVWEVRARKELAVLRGHEQSVHSTAFSPSGDEIVTASEDLTTRVWDAMTGKEMAILRGHAQGVNSAVFNRSGDRIVTGSSDTTARVWDATTGENLAILRGHELKVVSAVFSLSGNRIVSASDDTTARVWDTQTGKELAVLRGHERGVSLAAFNPSGDRILTASADTTARVWDAQTGKELAILRGHKGSVTSASFSPSGDRIVTASRDKTARVWDAVTGKELAVLRGHGEALTSAAFSPTGERIVTASEDATTRVWDTQTGKELAILRGHEDSVISANFSLSGDSIVTASEDGTARVWDCVSLRERFPTISKARAAERDIRPKVVARLDAGDDLDTVIAWLASDVAIDEIHRRAGLALLCKERHRREHSSTAESIDAMRLNQAAWDAARFIPESDRVISQALADAEHAVELRPSSPSFRRTLGVTQFRAAKYEEAIATLTASEDAYVQAERGEQPANWAFIAMAHHRLGHVAQAARARERFEMLASKDVWSKNPEVQVWRDEVEQLMDK